MGHRIRVLIVDDSVVACKVLSDVLGTDPGIEIAATAHSGASALSRLSDCAPDVVMLDVDMPGMDGLQTLAEIRRQRPHLPVIMCSGLTEQGSAVTVKALLGGASDYVTKPKGGRAAAPLESFRRELLEKIHALGNGSPSIVRTVPEPAAADPGWTPVAAAARPRIDVVAIGISTGGPKALAEVIPRLPADFPVPVLIVQHMPAPFTKSLADSLTRRSSLEVEEGFAGAEVVPGKVWIAPGGFHMRVVRRGARVELVIDEEPPVLSCRPSANLLFESVAAVYGASALGVIMTGMGQDGTEGAGYIRKAGGSIFVQDEASSVVWGMPGSVVKAGLHHRMVPIGRMGEVIHGAVLQGRMRKPPSEPPHGA